MREQFAFQTLFPLMPVALLGKGTGIPGSGGEGGKHTAVVKFQHCMICKGGVGCGIVGVRCEIVSVRCGIVGEVWDGGGEVWDGGGEVWGSGGGVG